MSCKYHHPSSTTYSSIPQPCLRITESQKWRVSIWASVVLHFSFLTLGRLEVNMWVLNQKYKWRGRRWDRWRWIRGGSMQNLRSGPCDKISIWSLWFWEQVAGIKWRLLGAGLLEREGWREYGMGSKKRFFVFCLAAPRSLQDLSSLARDWSQATAVKVPSPNHWTAREFPRKKAHLGKLHIRWIF